MSKHFDSNMETLFAMMAKAPESQLDYKLAKEFSNFNPDKQDARIFLLNARDLVVRYSWGSGFVINVFNSLLSVLPEETKDEQENRRRFLEEAEERGDPISDMLNIKG
jgi:hypothetical protein